MTLHRIRTAAVALAAAAMFLAIAAAASAADAKQPDDDITARIQRQYESLHSFQADIEQTLTNAASGDKRVRHGNIAFRAPGMVRWETTSPEPELIVAGDGPVWDYFADEQTAYKYPRQQILGGKTMLRFLSGQARLDEDFYVTVHREGASLVRLELVPKEPEANLVQAEAWVTDEMAMLTRVKLVDFFGNVNDVRLENLLLNPDLPDSLFTFTPPKGAEILDNTKQ